MAARCEEERQFVKIGRINPVEGSEGPIETPGRQV